MWSASHLYRLKTRESEVITITDNETIISMFNKRDERVLEQISENYGYTCRRVAGSILENEEEANECFNDALLSVWNSIPPAQPDNFYGYLLKTVRNISLNVLKGKKRLKRGEGKNGLVLDEIAEFLPSGENVESQIEAKERENEIKEALTAFLRTQKQDHRDIFILRYWRFSSPEEIAEEFGISENNVNVILSRLRKKLEQFLKKEGLM